MAKKKQVTKTTATKTATKKKAAFTSTKKKTTKKKSAVARQYEKEDSSTERSTRPERPIIEEYQYVNIIPCFDKKHNPKAKGPLTETEAKEFLDWQENLENLNTPHLFTDRDGNKVWCRNNIDNRPFDKQLASDYMLEHLRRKWKLNGETCIIDNTGMVQDAQHRFIGFIWAVQEWRKNTKWRKYWKEEPTMDCIIVTGISSDDETINTLNTGKPRSFADALYRSEHLFDLAPKNRRTVAKLADKALKSVWNRTCQAKLSGAPRLPHSEAFEFIDRHPRLLECVRHIYEEDEENKISGYFWPGEASAFMYLQATDQSERITYERLRSEEGLDFANWDKASEFWVEFAQISSKKLEPLKEELNNISKEMPPIYIRDKRRGLIVKAWNLYESDKEVTKEGIELAESMNTTYDPPFPQIDERAPLIGGIDLGGLTEISGEAEEDEDDNE